MCGVKSVARAMAAALLPACAAVSALPELPPGYPDRSADVDVYPGFAAPPPGYGEVPFWWWTGEAPDAGRLVRQVEELHKMGISGVQVNYSHYDTPGWPTEQDGPKIFSEEWWRVFGAVAEA
jgi:hypothetical protein